MMSFGSCLFRLYHQQFRCSFFTNNNKLFFCNLRFLSKSNQDLSSFEGKTEIVEESDFHLREQLEIDRIRNKSRLREDHRNIMLDKIPYSEPKAEHHLTVKHNRKIFGKYGLESGVNPGMAWPTKAEIEARLSFEKVAYPLTVSELVKGAEKEIQNKELEIQNQHRRVMENMAKLNTWKKELFEKITKREAEALAIKEKKEKLVEDVRRHFGFKIDPKDERFKEMLVIKEKEQKKKEKQMKIEEREKKALAKLLSKNDSTTDNKSQDSIK